MSKKAVITINYEVQVDNIITTHSDMYILEFVAMYLRAKNISCDINVDDSVTEFLIKETKYHVRISFFSGDDDEDFCEICIFHKKYETEYNEEYQHICDHEHSNELTRFMFTYTIDSMYVDLYNKLDLAILLANNFNIM